MSSLSSVSIHKTIGEALSHSEWRQAMVDEMSALHKSGTWELVSLPIGNLLLVVVGFMQLKLVETVRLIDLRLALLSKGILRYLG